MAKPLILVHQDVELPCFPEKVDRTRIYGRIDTWAQDEQGRRCELATLADDGRTLIGRGGTANATLSADGEWLERKTLKPVDPEGKPVTPVTSSFNAPVRLVEKATVDDYLSHNVKSVYLLSSEADLSGLRMALEDGTIFTFPFSYRGGLEADVGFLLASQDQHVFLVVGQPTRLHFVGLEQAAALDDEETQVEAEEDESLDFGMM